MHTQLKGIIEYITKRADEIGEDVTVERTYYGTTFVTIEAHDCFMFVVLGKNGGWRNVYYRDPLNQVTEKEKRKANSYWVRTFFNTVIRQRKLIEGQSYPSKRLAKAAIDQMQEDQDVEDFLETCIKDIF